VEQYSIDPDRLYIIGLSMGGFSTWAMIARYPGLPAAAVQMPAGGIGTSLTAGIVAVRSVFFQNEKLKYQRIS
jgi:predicted peptidase